MGADESINTEVLHFDNEDELHPGWIGSNVEQEDDDDDNSLYLSPDDEGKLATLSKEVHISVRS